MRFVLASAALVAAALLPSAADAFCRTTDVKPTLGYNPAESGTCWTQGDPLAWSATRIPYAIASNASKQVSLADATHVADLAFGTWNSARCNGQPLGVTAYDDGPIAVPQALDGDALAAWASCTESTACDASAHNVIVFDDDAWPYDDPVNTLALTTVTFGIEDGRIFEAYTEINSAEQKLTTVEPPPAGGNVYDLQAILTHEAGHFLGLAHATSTTSIMYAYYQPGAIALTSDDVDGICAAYPPPSSKGGGCSASPSIPISSQGSVALAATSFVAAIVFWRRRRTKGANPSRQRLLR